MFTLVRCHCCGIWEMVWDWDRTKPSYCEGCDYGRTGTGRGQCEYCKLYPQNLRHWQDKKPEMPEIHVCIR